MKGKSIKKIAFTIAEILITLGIIGIVAAITIPAVQNNYINRQYTAKLEKAYTQFAQALIRLTNDYGCDGLACTGLFPTVADNNVFGDALVQYFNVAKNCQSTTNKGCMSSSVSTQTDGSLTRSSMDAGPGPYRFVSADGVSFSFQSYPNAGANCNDMIGNFKHHCADLFIDVNGLQGPNNYGRDIFEFAIVNDNGPAIYPYGGSKLAYWKSFNGCNPPSYLQGVYCGGRVMEESWQMNY